MGLVVSFLVRFGLLRFVVGGGRAFELFHESWVLKVCVVSLFLSPLSAFLGPGGFCTGGIGTHLYQGDVWLIVQNGRRGCSCILVLPGL